MASAQPRKMTDAHKPFETYLNRFVPRDLQSPSTVIYGIQRNYELAFFNPGWYRFAAENSGEPEISRQWGLGRNVLDAIPDGLRDYYRDLFDACKSWRAPDLKPLKHEFECPSPTHYRRYTMMLYPIEEIDGVLVVNSLSISRPHELSETPAQGSFEEKYMHQDGCLHQCMCCRKVEHPIAAGRWDFIPDWVRSMPRNMSHGLCGFCVHYYYKNLGLSPPSFD